MFISKVPLKQDMQSPVIGLFFPIRFILDFQSIAISTLRHFPTVNLVQAHQVHV